MIERRLTAVHVVPVSGWWSVRLSPRQRAFRRFLRKRGAVRVGEEIAKREGVEFFLHRADGTVERMVSPT